MKIVQFIDTLNIGGAERMSVNLANTFVENSIDSYLIVSRNGEGLKHYLKPEVKLFCLNKRNSFDVIAFYKLVKLVWHIKPNYFHAHSTSVFWAILLKLLCKIKLIWHDHYGLSDQLHIHKRKAEIFVSRWIDYVVVVNITLEKWAENNLHVKPKYIKYISNFPYLNNVNPKKNNEKKILLNLANFRPQKDQLTLVESVAKIRDCGVKFEVWLAGAIVDAIWLEKVKERIDNLNLGDIVKIIGPVKDSSEILSKVDIGVLSSESEGLPVSLLEYGLTGLPVVATKVGQCEEVLDFGNCGVLVNKMDSNDLANGLLYLLTQQEQASIMGLKFQNRVKNKYGANQFFNNYKSLIGQ